MPDGQSLVSLEHDGFVFTSANATEEELQKTVGADAPPDEGTATSPEPQQVEATPPASPAEAPPAVPPPPPKGPEGRKAQLQAEINQLTRSKHQTRAEAEQTQQELAQLRAEKAEIQREIDQARAASRPAPPPEPPPEVVAAPRAPEPVLDDFEDIATWMKAQSQWTREQAKLDAEEILTQREQAAVQQQHLSAREQQEAARQHYMAQKWAEHEQRFTAYVEQHPDAVPLFQAAAKLPMSQDHDMLMTHVLHSEKGPEILRFLAEHPTECERIAALPAGPTLIELGRIEERLSAVKSGAAQKPRPMSRTSPPITPVGGGADVADDATDLSTLPFGPEYVRRMNALEEKTRRA